MTRKRLFLLLLLFLLPVAGAVWWRAQGTPGGDPVERLVADMVPIPGRDYFMGKYEVTQEQWEAVMGGNPSFFKGTGHPVECVSWEDCQEFLAKLNAHPVAVSSGLVFRLPTGEEWEFACRAGATGDYCRLADGTEITAATLGRVAWFFENQWSRPRWLDWLLSNTERLVDHVREVNWSEITIHRPVGRKAPNAYGLHDMHGNVWELTDTADGERRVGRGGSWRRSAKLCESSYRFWSSLDYRDYSLGLRLCASSRAE